MTGILLNLKQDKHQIKFEKMPDNIFHEKTDIEQYKVKLNLSAQELIKISQDIEKLDYVDSCCVTPDTTDMEPPELPSPSLENSDKGFSIQDEIVNQDDDDPTPDFTPLQTYLNDGSGMNVISAWDKGITGRFATVRHLDFGVYRNHEDLKSNIAVVHSRSESKDCNHGTASTGCIAATKNDFGVAGIAHDCSYYFYDTSDLELIERDVIAGDIVSLDIQFRHGNKFIPAIDNYAWWARINRIVDHGGVVILAAGNGGLDLSPEAKEITEYGDNGSMLVGACDARTGSRMSFSNYNHYTSLINSWGSWNVVTTGYSSLQKRPGNNRNYTKTFSGTSSATPLSSGALALIQSYAMEYYSVFFDSHAMRSIIQSGYDDGLKYGIGHRPNIMSAVAKIDKMLS